MSVIVAMTIGFSVRAAKASASRSWAAAWVAASFTWLERDISDDFGFLTIGLISSMSSVLCDAFIASHFLKIA